MISTRSRAALATLETAFAMAACGKDSTAPPQSFTLRVPAQTLTIHCGHSGSVSAVLDRDGFEGAVTVSTSGLPPGVTIDFTPNQFTGNTTTVTLDVSAEDWVIEGTYSITITGSSSIGSESVTFTLVIEEAPDFALSLVPPELSIMQGSTGTASVLIAREGGFAGAVSLWLVDPPEGISATFVPQGTTSNASTMMLSVPPSVTPGTKQVTIRGDASAMESRTMTFTLIVTQAPDFSLGVTPAALTVPAGRSGTATITITRIAGFDEPIGFSLSAPPAGVTASFTPVGPTGTSSTMTLTVAASVATGNHTLTILGEGDWTPRTTTLQLTVTEAPRITMGVNPNALTVIRGNTGTATVLVGREGGFTGAVTLALLTPPVGISATFNPPSPTGGSSTMTLTVADFVPAGLYSIWVNGSGEGVSDVAAELKLTVQLAPEISLALNPATLSIPQWQSAATSATITRINFAGNVTFASAGAPNGVTVSFNPQVLTGTAAIVSVEVGLLVPVGTYDIAIHASGVGVPTFSTTLQVSVTQAPGTIVDYQFCSPADRPAFFAVQDGNGPWKVVPSTEIGGVARYRFPLNAGYGGGVFIVPRLLASAASRFTGARTAVSLADAGTVYQSHIVFGTTQDLINEGADWCQETLMGGTFTGIVQGFAAGEAPFIAMGGEWATVGGAPSPAGYVLEDAALGIQDVVATRRAVNGLVDRFVILRDVNASQAGALPLVDFNGPNSVAALVGNVSITDPLGDWLSNSIHYSTGNGKVGQVTQWTGWSRDLVRPYPIVPPAAQRGGDVLGVAVRASIGLPDRDDDLRLAMTAVTPGTAAVAVTLGPRSPAATVSTVAVSPYLRLRAQGALLPEYPRVVNISYESSAAWMGNPANLVRVAATANYLAVIGSAATYDLTMPDLSGLPGFPSGSVLSTGELWITTQMWNVTGTARLSPNQPLVPGLQVMEGRTYRFQAF